MAFIGKTLILLFGAVSLMCLTWAALVYSQKMDYVPPVDQAGKKSPGRVEKAQKVTRELDYANARAYTRWSRNYDEMIQAEMDRAKRRDFSKGQIEILLSGMADGKRQAAQELPDSTDGSGLIPITNPVGRKTIQVKGQDLKTIGEYRKDLIEVAEAVPKIIKEMNDIQEQRAKVTDEIISAKGLRARIKEQERFEELASGETGYLEDFVTNRHAEAQLFVKRRAAMEARVKELKQSHKDNGTARE